MSITEKTAEKVRLHPRLMANEVYLRNPNIVGVQNPNVTTVRGTERVYGSKPLSFDVLPVKASRRRF